MATTKLPAVDVVLVTGPAGAGKTAFIEACVRRLPERWRRVGYVCHRFVQEFGNTPPLPPALRAGVKRGGFYASVFDFGSGCVCCSPRGDFRRTLLELRQQRSTTAAEKPGASQGVGPNLLFVETTGLADPGIFVNVLRDEECGTRLRAVVFVAECSTADAEDAGDNISDGAGARGSEATKARALGRVLGLLQETEPSLLSLDSGNGSEQRGQSKLKRHIDQQLLFADFVVVVTAAAAAAEAASARAEEGGASEGDPVARLKELIEDSVGKNRGHSHPAGSGSAGPPKMQTSVEAFLEALEQVCDVGDNNSQDKEEGMKADKPATASSAERANSQEGGEVESGGGGGSGSDGTAVVETVDFMDPVLSSGGWGTGVGGGWSGGSFNLNFRNAARHDRRYTAVCLVAAAGPGLHASRVGAMRSWLDSMLLRCEPDDHNGHLGASAAKGNKKGTALRIKGVVYLRGEERAGGKPSGASNKAQQQLFSVYPTSAPTAAVLIDATPEKGVRWTAVPLIRSFAPSSSPDDHHANPCYSGGGARLLEEHKVDATPAPAEEAAASRQLHCEGAACPLNGPGPSSDTDQDDVWFTGDFDAAAAQASIDKALNERCAVVDCEYRNANSHASDNDGWRQKQLAGLFCDCAGNALESKLFVLRRDTRVSQSFGNNDDNQSSSTSKVALLAPTFKRLLAPPGYIWVADEAIDFAKRIVVEHSITARIPTSYAASSGGIDNDFSGKSLDDWGVDGRGVFGEVEGLEMTTVTVTRHGCLPPLPPPSCYPAEKETAALPEEPPQPDYASAESESPSARSKLYYSAVSGPVHERRYHHVLRLFAGDLFVSLSSTTVPFYMDK